MAVLKVPCSRPSLKESNKDVTVEVNTLNVLSQKSFYTSVVLLAWSKGVELLAAD